MNRWFRNIDTSLQVREFGNDFNKKLEFANSHINTNRVAIIKVMIPGSIYNQLNHMNLDPLIFRSGTLVVDM